MERTLLWNTTIINPNEELVQRDALLSFNHENPVYPPDKIGYAGMRCGKYAPSIETPEPEDSVLDLEETYLLPGFIDLSIELYQESLCIESSVLKAYRSAGNALNRGITTIACNDTLVNVAVKQAGDNYTLWTPQMICTSIQHKEGYEIFYGAPDVGTAEEKKYIKAVEKAKLKGLKPAIATGKMPDERINGLIPIVRAAQLLCIGGYSNMEAIAGITCNNAKILGVDDRTGNLKAGMDGDVIAVNGNPIEKITSLNNVLMCARGGRLIWSHLKGFERIRFGLVPPGCPD